MIGDLLSIRLGGRVETYDCGNKVLVTGQDFHVEVSVLSVDGVELVDDSSQVSVFLKPNQPAFIIQ